MSSPFVYVPQAFAQPELQTSPYLFQYYNPRRISPYIPTAPLDVSPIPSPDTRSNRFFEEDDWYTPQPRPRRPSWHAGMSAPPAIGLASSYVPSSLPYQTYQSPPDRSRRRSFDARWNQESYQVPIADPWTIPSSLSYTTPSQVHPLLTGLTGGTRYLSIIFDLSSPTFNPLKVVGPNRTQPISPQELAQQATYPPTTRLTITCDSIPQWPIYLDYNAATAAASGGYFQISSPSAVQPINLGDVLLSIHQSLQTQITQVDWARLSDSDEGAVTRAYTRRCRAMPSMQQLLSSQGVRRVDYLLKRCMFAGLSRGLGDDGFDNLKLMVTSRSSV